MKPWPASFGDDDRHARVSSHAPTVTAAPAFVSGAPATAARGTMPSKLLAILRGGMAVTVGRKTSHCSAGDRLLIPGHTEHGAVVGPAGCDFFWSEKLLEQKGSGA